MAEVGSNGDAGPDVIPKIVKQIEYYFGDVNLMRDRFLKEKIQEDDGWVTIETMLKFNRLKQLTEDPKLVCDALKQSTSGLMEVNDGGDKIRRNPSKPLPGDTKERRDDMNARSIYAKAFPLDIKLDDLMAFFETYGPVETIFMKKDFHKKTFKGSVFVTFTKKEDAEKFIKEEETKYKDQPLEAKHFKADYFKEKSLSRKGKGKKDDSQEKKDKDKEEAKEETEEDREERAKQQMTKGAVLHIKGLNVETNIEEIKRYFGAYGDVGWVDFDRGATQGYLRLREPNSAASTLEKAKAANDGKLVIRESELEVRVVEGDEELEYWKKMFKDIADKFGKNKKKGGGGRDRRQGGRNQRGGRRNRGGPQGKRRHNKKKDDEDDDDSDGGEEESEEPPTKAKKTEETEAAE